MRACTIAVAVASVCFPVAVGAQEGVYPLDGLVVTAAPTPVTAEAVPNHVTVLDGDALRARGIATVSDALRDVAGVDVVQSGSFGSLTSVFLRGAESDHALVLVDGVQVNQAGGGFDFASLTTDNVERIEIVRGPGSALYGSDAVAGVIHVVTRTGAGSPTGSVRVETTSYREAGALLDGVRLSADVAGGTDRAGYALSVAHGSTTGNLPFNNRHVRTVLSGNARLTPDDRTRLQLSLRLTDRTYHFPTDGSGAVVDRNQFNFSDETLGRLSVAREVTDWLELEGLLGLSEADGGTDDDFDDGTDTDQLMSLDHFRRATGEVRAHVRAGGTVLTGGYEIEEERQRSFLESTSAFGPYNSRSESERLNHGVFAHATGGRGPVSLSGGARLEDNERFGTAVTWQAGVSTAVPGLSGTRLRGSVGHAIKEPTFSENFANGGPGFTGNPDLEPERSLSWEVGLQQDVLGGAASLSATYFDQRFEDLIQYTSAPPSASDPNFFNVAEATAGGLELGASATVESVELGADWTWLRTEVTNPGFDSGPGATFVDGARLLRRPEHSFSFRASGPVGDRLRLHSGLAVVGARDDRDFATFPATPVELPGYRLWSLGLEWLATEAVGSRPGVTLSIRAENLLDERYEEVYGFRATGRQLFLGVSTRLGSGG